jgi:hypothetical protein
MSNADKDLAQGGGQIVTPLWIGAEARARAHASYEAEYSRPDKDLAQGWGQIATPLRITEARVNEHLKKIFSDRELQEDSVIRKFRITASKQIPREAGL